MKFLFWCLFIPFAVAVTVFAVNNRGETVIDLTPAPYTLTAPLYLMVLLPALAGFIAGICADWFAQGKWRRKAREMRKRVTRLEAEAIHLHETMDQPSPDGAMNGNTDVVLPDKVD